MTAPHIEPARVDRNWRAITAGLDAPRPRLAERALQRLGVPSHVTRVALATPALRRAWFVATGLVMLIGLGAADAANPRDDLFVLLVLAPLVPLLGVALAFGPDADPAYEVTLSSPMRGIELVVTRAVTVLAVSAGLLAVASLLTPGRSVMAFAWVLPALALCAAALAAMTVTSPRRATAVVAVTWTVVVTAVRRNAADPLAAFGASGQIVLAIVLAAAAAVVWHRRERFDLLEVGW